MTTTPHREPRPTICRLATIAVIAAAVSGASARQLDSLQALDRQLARIFQSDEFQPPRFGPARWLAGGTAYTTLEEATDGSNGTDIVRYDAASGARDPTGMVQARTSFSPAVK